MLISPALKTSMYDIAVRTRQVKLSRRGIPQLEYHYAIGTEKGPIFVINARSGAIRPMNLEDQNRDDWKPFMPKQVTKSRKVRKITD